MSYNTTLVGKTQLVAVDCWCGIWFAAPDNLVRMFDDEGYSLYCPLGHSCVRKETEAQKLRKKLEQARARTVWERDQREATERSLRATKAAKTRLANRVAAGVCPWCKRSVRQLRDHVASKHPEHIGEVEHE